MHARDLMTADVVTIRGREPVRRALHALFSHEIRTLPVVDEAGELIGVFTDRDLREHLGDTFLADDDATLRSEALDDPVESVMTPEPTTVSLDTDAAEVIDALIDGKFGALPVVNDARHVEGIISYIDVLRALRDRLS